MRATAERIGAALAAPLADLGVDLEGVEVERAGRRHVVRVVVDRDGGVDLDAVADVSRVVSGVLDGPDLTDVLPGPFVLEVSSPGVDRPLTQPRHWQRARGRLVVVDLLDGTTVTGRVGASGDGPDGATATVTTEAGEVELRLDAVRRAVVQVEFARADGDDSSDSDETGR